MGYRSARLWQRQLSAVESLETMIAVRPKVKEDKKEKKINKDDKKKCVKGVQYFSLPLL